MIPTIEEIVAGVSTRQFTQLQAVKWLYQHIDTATNDDGLRDHFAGLAMEAMIQGSWPDTHDRAEIAKRAYAMADAMLKERSK